jgi:MFS family permease
VDLSLPAIPAMVHALGTTLSHSQQIVGVFMIGMACGQIPAGLSGDRLGRLPILYVGMTIFACFSQRDSYKASVRRQPLCCREPSCATLLPARMRRG